MPSKNERVELEMKIMKYRELMRQAWDPETTRRHARSHWDHLFDRDGRTDSIVGPDRRPESQALRHVDAARTGQLVGDRRGDYACRQQSMGNAALENGACRELLVDVDGVVVAGHGGEQDDVGFRDGLGEP